MHPSHFISFKTDVSGIPLPDKFTFPFYYEPHALAVQAAKELQEYLLHQNDFQHNFGLVEDQEGLVIGKMIGVLVVKTHQGEIGYLAGCSGKLADSNNHKHFVPPVFDILTKEGFFKEGEAEVNTYNAQLLDLEQADEWKELNQERQKIVGDFEQKKQDSKTKIKLNKQHRALRRIELLQQNDENAKIELEELRKASIQESYHLKFLQRDYQEALHQIDQQIAEYQHKIQEFKNKRALKSAAVQQQIFENYTFLNSNGEERSLLSIFRDEHGIDPPAGAGECAAPKLLHYAYKNKLEPICLAEFWWGKAPPSEVRAHGNYYPACKGKCEPILSHMLQGLQVDDNPLLENPALGKTFKILYEDEVIIVVDKPAEFLSVPGKSIEDSVYARLRRNYPEADGPLLVHRLDMSTSGILVAAKNKWAHEFLQRQFIKRTIKKRYVALLDGVIKSKGGLIDLPLRVDLDDRPRQLVCYEHGKSAITKWELIKVKGRKSLVYFYPLSGRTHQLRVHAAHLKGLCAPIVGDDLYGKKENRLHLHAEQITFIHPATKVELTISAPVPF